jgi:hypothetical protein
VTLYEISVIGSLGPAARQAFADLAVNVEIESAVTVVSGDFDQPRLRVLLNQMQTMGLELVAIRRRPRPLPASTPAVRNPA